MRRRFLLITNPTAGRGRLAVLEAVLKHLALAKSTIEPCEAGDAAAAEASARAAGRSMAFDAVIAAGGDGTIRSVASGLAGTAMPLGVIPMGTGNVLGHELGLTVAPNVLAGLLLNGETRSVSLATANGAHFLLMAGIGFDGRVIAALNHGAKQLLGKAAYAGPVLRALMHPSDTLNVTLDGTSMTASWAVIANARHYGGRFVLAPHTSLTEPGLQAILFHGDGWPRRVQHLFALALGRLGHRAAGQSGEVTMHACTRAVITSAAAVPVQLDGDVASAATRLDVRLVDASVQIICGSLIQA